MRILWSFWKVFGKRMEILLEIGARRERSSRKLKENFHLWLLLKSIVQVYDVLGSRKVELLVLNDWFSSININGIRQSLQCNLSRKNHLNNIFLPQNGYSNYLQKGFNWRQFYLNLVIMNEIFMNEFEVDTFFNISNKTI